MRQNVIIIMLKLKQKYEVLWDALILYVLECDRVE